MTVYEKAIYGIVNESYDHLTAEQIFALLKKTYPRVVLATVYNNLGKLCDAGFIRRITLDGQADRFDRTVRHDHLVCSRCGKIADISFDDLTSSLKNAVGDAFLSYDLKIFYLCPECRNSETL